MVSREGRVPLQLSLADAYRRAEEALLVIGAVVTTRDFPAGRLVGRVPMSFKSWGENVEVTLSGTDGSVMAHVQSASRWRTTLFDWGKNADNVTRCIGWLSGQRQWYVTGHSLA